MSNIIGGTVVWNLDVDDSKLKSGLDGAKKNVESASKDIANSSNSIKSNLSSIGDAFENAERGSQMFAKGLLAIGAAGVTAIGFGVKMAADLETMTMGFVTLLGSTEKAGEAIEMIKKDAAKTPFELPGLIKANQMLTAVTKDAGRSEGILLNVGKALTAMGRSGSELDNVIYNLQQIANTGKITEIDIRQFGNAGINVLEMLADYYGTTKAEAVDMVKNSKDAFADLEGAFKMAGEGSGRFAKAFELQGGTFNQVMSNFKDNLGITMGEFVKQTGIFDTVKDALGRITIAIGELSKPENIAKIKELFDSLKNNLPIIAGIIIGGLIPAFVGLGISIWTAMAPLLPFIAIGAALGVAVKLLIDAMGGWDQANIKLQEALTVISNIYNTWIKPALDMLWSQIKDNLLPAFQKLWDILSPVLIPILKILGAIVLGVVVVALNVIIGVISLLINWWASLAKSITGIVQYFKDMVKNIGIAVSSIYKTITQPFIDAWNYVSGLLDKIKNGIRNALDPTVRHSPSLVDRITSGVSDIIDQYSRLENMSLPSLAGEVSYSPSVLDTNTNSNKGTKSSSGVTVNIAEANVASEDDIDALGREFGFRYSLAK